MRLSWLLFLSASTLLLIMAAVFLLPPSTFPKSGPHAIHASMVSAERGSLETLWLGYSMGLAIIAVMAALVLLGLRKNGQLGTLGRWMGVGFMFMGLIFTALVASYVRYANRGQDSFFGGLPAPTAWMIYGVWLFPMLMILVCSFHFDRWYFTPKDQRSIEELLRSSQTRTKRD